MAASTHRRVIQAGRPIPGLQRQGFGRNPVGSGLARVGVGMLVVAQRALGSMDGYVSVKPNTHQPKPWEEAAGRMIRRGEGGGAGLGGPLWSPVVGPLPRPRPYGSSGLLPLPRA